MCTIVLLRRPGHPWPLVLGANRDEMADRPWCAPARHWPEHPHVVAGRDEMGGGTWLGVNDAGVVAAVANRRSSLGPAPDKRSRGELPLAALAYGTAAEAAEALGELPATAYRPFNLVVADHQGAFWLRHRGEAGGIERFLVPAGLSMLTAGDLDDPSSPRTRAYLPRFRTAAPPDPERGDWRAWEALLGARERAEPDDPTAAMTIVTATGFGTVSSSLIAVRAAPAGRGRLVWRFAPGPPDRTAYEPVEQ